MSDRMMPDISGKELSLTSAKGENGLLVIFSCNTCPWVQAWEDRYLTLAEQCREKSVGMIAVNSNEGSRDGVDSMDEMRARAAKMGYTFPYVVDRNSELADAFGATRTPDVFLLDKDLTLVYRGAIDDNAKDPASVTRRFLSEAIDALSAGREIAAKETKSIGCTIKRL
ncbi:thioredoxin family protein [bacterium]|nr:thioredoxin family protein [bacterium]